MRRKFEYDRAATCIRVHHRADPRHVGTVVGRVDDHATVIWDETGWESRCLVTDLVIDQSSWEPIKAVTVFDLTGGK